MELLIPSFDGADPLQDHEYPLLFGQLDSWDQQAYLSPILPKPALSEDRYTLWLSEDYDHFHTKQCKLLESDGTNYTSNSQSQVTMHQNYSILIPDDVADDL